MNSSDFRKEARNQLIGKWKNVVLITLAYFIVNFVLNLIQENIPENSFLYFIFSVIMLVIDIPLAFGFTKALLDTYNEKETSSFSFVSLAFSNFSRSWKIALKVFLKLLLPVIICVISIVLIIIGAGSSIVTGLSLGTFSAGSLVLILIGFILYLASFIWLIMKSYYYSLAQIIAADDESLNPTESVEKSYNLMKGNRGKLFILQLSFIGWAILSIFTLGIGYLWLVPYIQFAEIAFYKYFLDKNDTKKENNTEPTDNNPIQNQ